MMLRLTAFCTISCILAGCAGVEKKEILPPVIDYQSKDRISYYYDNFEVYNPVTPQIEDMADAHCKKTNRVAVYSGARDAPAEEGFDWSTLTEKSTYARLFDFECISPKAGSSRIIVHNPTNLDNYFLLRRIARNQPLPLQ